MLIRLNDGLITPYRCHRQGMWYAKYDGDRQAGDYDPDYALAVRKVSPPRGTPTPEQIAERAAEIRKGWDAQTEIERRVTKPIPATIPVSTPAKGKRMREAI